MRNVIGYLHTHWDREWYREFDAFRLRLVEVFDEIIEKLESNEIPYFYLDGQTAALEDYLELRPEKKDVVKRLIKEKKLDAGPFYCSADSFLVSGEMYIRNLYTGIKKSKEFGEKRFIGYIPDSFGHSEKIPEVLKSFDIDKSILWRGLGDLNADLEWNEIKTTYLVQGYYQNYLTSNLPFDKTAEGIKNYLDKIREKSSENLLFPIGGDHLGLPVKPKEQINKLNKILKDYEIRLSSPFEYFNTIKTRKKVKGEFLDNSKNFILQGVYSSRTDIKQLNALCQWNLTRITEPLQAVSGFCYGTREMQSECDYTCKLLIKNHAHDSIYGCSTDSVNKDVINRYKRVGTLCDEITRTVKYHISKDEGEFCVFNLSNFEYDGIVEIKTNKKLPPFLKAQKTDSERYFEDKLIYNTKYVPVTEDYTDINTYLIDLKNLKPFSLTKLTKENINKKNNLKITENSIENAFIKVKIKAGQINITDKRTKNEYKNMISLIDLADIGDSYNFGALPFDTPINAEIKRFTTEGKGFVAKLKIDYQIAIPKISTENSRSRAVDKCRFNLILTLYNQSKNLEFCAIWENKSKNHILKIGFNLPEPIVSTVSEDLFGTIKRDFNPDFDVCHILPAQKGVEIKLNTAPMQRFVSAQGVEIITKGLNEYEVNKNTLYLTLLRATGIISNPRNITRGTPAGPPIETPDLQMLGLNRREFVLSFENSEKEMFKRAEEFYRPTVSLFSKEENRQFLEITNKNILVYAIKKHNKNLVLRLCNITDKAQKTKIKTEFNMFSTNSNEEKISEIKDNNLNFGRYEIKTVMLKYKKIPRSKK